MKFANYTIVFQEVPDEITLVFEISNCSLKCEGCHSQHLQQDIGEELTLTRFKEIIGQYVGLITNVAFFGGEQYSEIMTYLDYALSLNLKTTLWTGSCNINDDIKQKLTYLKTGPYIPELGDLKSDTTNQIYIEVATGRKISLKERKIGFQ